MDNWRSRYQDIYNRETSARGIPPEIVKLLVQSENGQEDPRHINYNSDGTVDVGLLQVNAHPNDTAEIQRLMDPNYNIKRGMDIYLSRLQHLGDPVLALASYNLGAGGAALDPDSALSRAQLLYNHSGIALPQTPFTQDPHGFVKSNMSKYMTLGLVRPTQAFQGNTPQVKLASQPTQNIDTTDENRPRHWMDLKLGDSKPSPTSAPSPQPGFDLFGALGKMFGGSPLVSPVANSTPSQPHGMKFTGPDNQVSYINPSTTSQSNSGLSGFLGGLFGGNR